MVKIFSFNPEIRCLLLIFRKLKAKDEWHILAGPAFLRPCLAFYMPFAAFNGEIKAWNNNNMNKNL